MNEKSTILTFMGAIIVMMFSLLTIYRPQGIEIGTLTVIALFLYVSVTIYVYRNKRIK